MEAPLIPGFSGALARNSIKKLELFFLFLGLFFLIPGFPERHGFPAGPD
jgi:hypothetical protein